MSFLLPLLRHLLRECLIEGNTKEEQLLPPSILLDFWVKVTPGILQLVSHSKVLAEMVNLHFLSLMEALMECRSTILAKLMPLWCPVLHAYNVTVSDSNKPEDSSCLPTPFLTFSAS